MPLTTPSNAVVVVVFFEKSSGRGRSILDGYKWTIFSVFEPLSKKTSLWYSDCVRYKRDSSGISRRLSTHYAIMPMPYEDIF